MACEIQASGDVELYFYGELDADARRAVSLHLASCGECGRALDNLRTLEELLSARARVGAPPDDDWAPLMARVARGVEGERMPLAAAAPPPAPHVRPRPVPAYLAMAALLTLVTASVAYVASQRGPAPAGTIASSNPRSAPDPGVAAGAAAAARFAPAAESQDADFTAVSEQLFDRSKLVILGLASRDPQTATAADWGYERQLAGTLLEDTRLYKQAAEARGLGTLAGVLSDLELVLLQASLSDQRDATTLDRLQRLIRKRDLVSRMEFF